MRMRSSARAGSVLALTFAAAAMIVRADDHKAASARPVVQAQSHFGSPAPSAIRGAHYPALSPDGKRLCFEYQGDLWTVDSDGGVANRLTVHEAYDAYPHWSPDGRWIAFSSNRHGNFDIFLIPAKGGEARRLTYNSSEDIVQDWSPDGSQILFSAGRDQRTPDLYTISVKNGRLRRITNDRSASRYASFMPDGKSIIYTRGRQEWWRPRYRGSANSEIYSIDLASGKTHRLTNYDGFDAWPLPDPDGKRLYFVSDRSGISNVWKESINGAGAAQLTQHTGEPVRFPAIARNGSRIAYERDFEIYTLDLQTQAGNSQARLGFRDRAAAPYCALPEPQKAVARPTPLRILAYADSKENSIEHVNSSSGASGLSVSPDAKSLAFSVRGKIWTVSTAGGDAEQISKSPAAEYSPVWSADSSTLAYASDRNGNLDIFIADAKSKSELQITDSPADDDNPQFSPNGRLLSFVRRGGSEPGLYVVAAPAVGARKAGEPAPPIPAATLVGPGAGVGSYDWSPDGRWIAYSRRDASSTSDIWVVPAVGGTPVNVTRYPGTNSLPRWTRDGRKLVFLSTRGGDFQSMGLYSVDLMPRPPRDDEAPGQPSGANDEASQRPTPDTQSPSDEAGQRRRPQGGQPQPGQQGAPPQPQFAIGVVPPARNVLIEFEDIENRAKPVVNSRDTISSYYLAPDGRTALTVLSAGGAPAWWAIDLNTGSMNRAAAGGETGGTVQFALDGSGFYFVGPAGAIFRMSRGAPVPTRVGFSAFMNLDRHVEMAEAFNEAWRHLRTEFYDPKMHGADWQTVRHKYEPLLKETTAKEDFAWLLSSMIGELNASHLGVTPAPSTLPAEVTAQLGLTFDQDYPGPGLRVKSVMPHGPADQLGRHVESGEYVMAIDGEDVSFNESMFRPLLDKVDKSVDLTVSSKPAKEGARTVKVRAISRAALDDLEYERWVQTRREKVQALSGGRLAYIHIRAMDQPSLRKFQRELFGDAQNKEGLVLDVRFNGGGRIHDDLFALLLRKPHAFEMPRDSERSSQPFQVWNRPAALLINEGSASDAEIFPNGFREYGLGKLVGVPTYGGVIGTVNITLIDGTTFRIPRTGWYTLGGKNLENMGVQPDIRAEMTPEDYARDDDKQLEAAVKTVLSELSAKRR